MKNIGKHLIGLIAALAITVPSMAQRFEYTYNGTTIEYKIISVQKHEAEVYSVPKKVTEVTVPAVVSFNGENFKVIQLNWGSFRGCNLLKSVTLPNTIKTIEKEAFEYCSWLRNIVFPSGLEEIGDWVFKDCESLTSVKLPPSLKKIGCNIFQGCENLTSISIPKEIGMVIDDSILVLNTEGKTVSEDRTTWNGSFDIYEYGNRRIHKFAFGKKLRIVTYDEFRLMVINSSWIYLQTTKGKSTASIVKRILVNAGMFDDVLEFYPNDAEVKQLKTIADAKDLIELGDALRDKRQYAEAKDKYMEALQLTPNDKLIQMRLTSIEDDIAEAERQRKEAEERARRAAEEQQVRRLVDLNVMWANNKIKQWNLEEAVGLLQQAIDTTKAHSYDYRLSEMNLRIDSIQRVQASFADVSNSFDYKYYRPDLWETTNHALSIKIRSFLLENEKTIKRNKLSLSLYTYQEGSFQLGEASKPLTKLSQELLKTEHLPNFVIDNEPRKGRATFDYSIEYAKGIVKVHRSKWSFSVTPKFTVSNQLESDINRMFTSKLRDLPSSCDGNYKYDVTSIDINGQTEYTVLLKGYSFRNGPQNVWKSLLVPGWGDKYVSDDGKFDWWKTAVSYGFVGLGVSFLTSVLKYETKTSEWVYDSTWVDVSDDPFYVSHGMTGWWATSNPHQVDRVINRSTEVGIAFVAIGAAVWIGDVIYVWIKGAKNKKSNAERLGRISFAYDAARDMPVMNYTLRF